MENNIGNISSQDPVVQNGGPSLTGQKIEPDMTLGKTQRTIYTLMAGIILFITLVTTVAMIGRKNVATTKASGVLLKLSASETNPKIGDSVRVYISVDSGDVKVAAAKVSVLYNPSEVDVQGIAPVGDFVPVVLKPGAAQKTDAVHGHADIVLGASVGDKQSNPKSGSAIIAQLTMNILSGQTISLQIDPASEIAVVGGNTNALSSTVPLTMTIKTPVAALTSSPVPGFISRGAGAKYIASQFGLQSLNPSTPAFADVLRSADYFGSVEAMYAQGVTTGCGTNPLRFCPDDPLTRGAAVAFLVRISKVGITTSDTVPVFTDVPVGYVLFPYIQRFYRLGLTSGCSVNPIKFCPDDPVSMPDLNTFISRIKGVH